MFKVLFILIGGILLGSALKKHDLKIFKHSESMMTLTICVMILAFGISIGSNPDIISNIGKYGLRAGVIAVLGITGSLVAAYVANRLYAKKGGRK